MMWSPAAIDPIADMRANAAYRAISAAELLRRTVLELAMDLEAAT
jgi:xanthine dehydrogenase iron-sulfur cluster and FAD-binding subunit A